MFCALLGQDIGWAFTGPLVLWLSGGVLGIASLQFSSGIGKIRVKSTAG